MITMDTLLTGDLQTLGEEAIKLDLNRVAGNMVDSQYRGYLTSPAGREHYQLLALLTRLFEGQTIFDIGTHYGNSSLALSFNPNVRIISYDIVEMKRILMPPFNVEYKHGNFMNDPEVLSSPFIFVDVDPHDGIQEKDFHDFFLEKEYKGIVLWDDIHCNPAMIKWWNELTGARKVDLTSVGHWSGTGMTVYE